MIGLTFLLAPLALFGADAAPAVPDTPVARHGPDGPGPMSVPLGFDAAPSVDWPSADQMRVERRVMLRITPMRRAQREMAADIRSPATGRFTLRPINACLPIDSIRSSQVSASNQVLLYLKDRRIVSARLGRACRAQSFYSGFYVEQGDGQLCAGRDALQSRSGASCALESLDWLMVRRPKEGAKP